MTQKVRKKNQLVRDDDPQFARFWAIYPRRVAKKDARQAWTHLRPDDRTVDAMIAALAWQVSLPAWRRDGGQFIPYPASWLRAERWQDEQPPRTPPRVGVAVAAWSSCSSHTPPCTSQDECRRRNLEALRARQAATT